MAKATSGEEKCRDHVLLNSNISKIYICVSGQTAQAAALLKLNLFSKLSKRETLILLKMSLMK